MSLFNIPELNSVNSNIKSKVAYAILSLFIIIGITVLSVLIIVIFGN